MIKKLHHAAFRCRNSEQTRAFYEDFLGLPLVASLRLRATHTGRPADVLHTFYALDDGSALAFFEVPEMPFEFKSQHDFDLHLALEVDVATLEAMFARGRAANIETRGVIDHGLIDSVYFRDPNGYVVEISAKRPGHDEYAATAARNARQILDAWQASRPRAA